MKLCGVTSNKDIEFIPNNRRGVVIAETTPAGYFTAVAPPPPRKKRKKPEKDFQTKFSAVCFYSNGLFENY